MDAPEDRDVKLQRVSADLLLEFEVSLPRFLWCTGDTAARTVRRVVRQSTTGDLIKLLEPFQEWPQLLDSRLSSLLPPLVQAFIEYLNVHSNGYRSTRNKNADFTSPIPRAICRILYTLCKVRGGKVITRFFNNEPKYLEPMLDAFKLWSQPSLDDNSSPVPGHGPMVWEEKYIMLLWISHLLLAPFDLATITSASSGEFVPMSIGLELPAAMPPIAARIISLSTDYLASSSKERESAVALLVRIALRPDMCRAGLLDALIRWALSSLESPSPASTLNSVYAYIGVLSFIAGLVNSGETASMTPFLIPILKCIQRINVGHTQITKSIISSAIGRKVIIKILRSIIITMLHARDDYPLSSPLGKVNTLLEDVIEQLMLSLADKDTPVRLAASKALSVIAVNLKQQMAGEIVEAIVGSLEENVLWETDSEEREVIDQKGSKGGGGFNERSMNAVNPLRWHGLVLTLSHLLYRRSPPPAQLATILDSLMVALSFEQRSAAGSSIGTNVRDAACFGIWSLARRYTTKELMQVDVTELRAAIHQNEGSTVLQVLANHLVVAASLDLSGNIRRGASAALQELVGRHPDTVTRGIDLVQVVDYHTVALRSRALKEVAIDASRLSHCYWHVLSVGLLGWRGIGSPDADSRRLAGSALGLLAVGEGLDDVEISISRVRQVLKRLKIREIEKQHGLLLSLEGIVRQVRLHEKRTLQPSTTTAVAGLWDIFQSSLLTDKNFTSAALRPELTAEAACSLISALASVSYRPGNITTMTSPNPETISHCVQIITLSFMRTEEAVILCASRAAESLFGILDNGRRDEIVRTWRVAFQDDQVGRLRPNQGQGTLAALGAVFHYYSAPSPTYHSIIDILVKYTTAHAEIETRILALKSLREGVISSGVLENSVVIAVLSSLQDYTTDQRGDVGSLLRVEAIDAVAMAWQRGLLKDRAIMNSLVARVCGLAVEKLDKVRFRAWCCLESMWDVFETGKAPRAFPDVARISTFEYYMQMLSVSLIEWVRSPLLEGFVTSAGAGSESVLRASRAAFVAHSEKTNNGDIALLCNSLIGVLKRETAKDRLAVPVLEICGFLFDTGVLQRLKDANGCLNWHDFCTLVHNAHHKTGNVHRLRTAIDTYAGLATVPELSRQVLDRLTSMLLHPFPKIRMASAEALYNLTEDTRLFRVDWSIQPRDLRRSVLEIRKAPRPMMDI